MTEKLKSCPFCGGEAKIIERNHDRGNALTETTYRVQCLECGIMTLEDHDPEKVVRVWNLRADQSADTNKMVPLTLDELREMDGKPVWVTFEPEDDGTPISSCWMLVNVKESRIVTEYEWVDFVDYAQTWLAYLAKPESGDSNA